MPLSKDGGIAVLTKSEKISIVADMEGSMSDGPHKSLPMKPGWKCFSEGADKGITETEDLIQEMVSAIDKDVRSECSMDLIDAVEDLLSDRRGQLSLEADDGDKQRFEDLRRQWCGSSLAEIFVTTAEFIFQGGLSGTQAHNQLWSIVFLERALAGLRQIEEHYLRRVGARRFDAFLKRLREVEQQFDPNTYAKHYSISHRIPRPRKRDQLEDGARL